MNVKPVPVLSGRINELRLRTAETLNEWVRN
jgi:hypothetical protein